MLDNLEELLEGGALMHSGRRYLLLEPASLVDLQKSMDNVVGTAAVGQALYLSAFRQGNVLTAQTREELSLGPEEALHYMSALCRQMGWGRIEITSFSLGGGTLELEVFHSAFAEEYGKAADPVCHLIRGFYAGVWQAVIGCEVEGLELHCRSVEGPGPCTFMFTAAAGRQAFKVSVNPDGNRNDDD
jgi:predicted hydrocarbon binding protein